MHKGKSNWGERRDYCTGLRLLVFKRQGINDYRVHVDGDIKGHSIDTRGVGMYIGVGIGEE